MKAVAKHRDLPAGRKLQSGHTLYWWAEVLAILGYYFVYSAIRNWNASNAGAAFDNAKHVIQWERWIGIYHEETLQDWALHFKPLIIAANYFYGSLHFVVTIGVAVFLFRRFTNDYPFYRNTLAVTTALALIGFRLFPLMPPRLLDDAPGPGYGYIDTLADFPTFWSFNSGAVSKISNQFAAMPSVHIAWATWCALALVPRVKHRWAKVLAIMYPTTTTIVIVITANHYILDAAGGLIALAAGWFLAARFTRAGKAPAPTEPI